MIANIIDLSCSKTSIGVLLGSVSGIAYSFGSFMVDQLTAFNAILILWYLYIIRLGISISWSFAKRYFPSEANTGEINAKDVFFVVLHALLASSCMIFGTMSYKFICFADANSIIMSGPGLIAFLEKLVNGTPCGMIEITVSFLSTTGLLLVLQPDFIFGSVSENNLDKFKGNVCAVLSLLSMVAYYINSKNITNERFAFFLVVTSATGLSICSVCLFVMNVFKLPQTSVEFFLLFGICVAWVVAQIFEIKGLLFGSPLATKIGTMVDIPVSYAIQCIYLHKYPSAFCIIGVIFIITSSIIFSCKSVEVKSDQRSDYSKIRNEDKG
ncbi:Uncharacterised protein r2_g1067 [Pycnogonum litorale]